MNLVSNPAVFSQKDGTVPFICLLPSAGRVRVAKDYSPSQNLGIGIHMNQNFLGLKPMTNHPERFSTKKFY